VLYYVGYKILEATERVTEASDVGIVLHPLALLYKVCDIMTCAGKFKFYSDKNAIKTEHQIWQSTDKTQREFLACQRDTLLRKVTP
jgi:hypothetical protein